MAAVESKSLYERLGGYDAIAAVTGEFLARVQGDPEIGGYWKGHSDDSKQRERQLTVDFLCEAAGGPTFYAGRDMKTSHRGLGITQSEWDIVMTHCLATLDHFNVQEAEKNDVCSFMESLKDDIVEPPA